MTRTLILGGGFTGLAAGITADATVYEAATLPGGLGASYELDGYRFEKAGGHWLFGGDPSIIGFVKALTPCKRYERKASVFFPETGDFYPYPLQSHPDFQKTIEYETSGEYGSPIVTMKDALRKQFGITLCQEFFWPFNDLYTAQLMDRIAPQDIYKSPSKGKGYNVSFLYPTEGLGMLARKMAARCQIRFDKRAKIIDIPSREIEFEDGSVESYDHLISTLPLNRMMDMVEVAGQAKPDPFCSVLVLNIGAVRGPNCPDSHWVYVPSSKSGFHRVGFYSNVDKMFFPPGRVDRVSMYIEKAEKGYFKEIRNSETDPRYIDSVVNELREWGWIKELDVCDANFVDVAYTYRNVGSTWRKGSLALLEKHDIFQCGRFARWKFAGIMESIKEGFEAGVKYG